MGMGPIPWTAIREYAGCHGINDPEEFDVFRGIIGAMDSVFLEHMAEKQKKPAPSKPIDKPARRR